ncbi:MAG: hypothetical protein EZS28_039833 [Streblomastix strix]|uniref:Uncharacterized protein n=1 Tax=Streblomastix strix TaxID=222440 RepID=A0A5J4U2U7_9EUKA|nr:MAG: hypothetical protein EZS28_039833 [Streblomastix strix]
MQKRKRNLSVVVAAVAVAATASKYKKIGQEREIRQFRESIETRTGWRTMNAIDKWRKRDKLNLIKNNRQRTNNNPNHNNHRCKKIQQQMKTRHKGHQQHSPSPRLKETLAILRTISPGDLRGYKEKEPERKQPKLQHYAGLMDVVERFHEIMKPIIEKEKKKPKVMFPGQYKKYPNKDGLAFFYPPKNHRPTPIPRPKDLNLSKEQQNQFDVDVREGVVSFCLQLTDSLQAWTNLPKGSYIPGLLNISDGVARFINLHPQIYQSIPEAVIGLIIFAAEQIVQSEIESKDQEQLTNELERIVTDGTDDNGDDDQSEHAIEPKHFINKNDGLRKNDSGTHFDTTVNGEANSEINIKKNIGQHSISQCKRIRQTRRKRLRDAVIGSNQRK